MFRWTWAAALLVGLALGCAKKSRGTEDPGACMRDCEAERCEYDANSTADNDEYLECLETCQTQCNG